MFQLWDLGVKSDLLLKNHVKKWEYKLYGGRPELYPQDRTALLAMTQFKNDKMEHDQKHLQKQQQMKQRFAQMHGGGSSSSGGQLNG